MTAEKILFVPSLDPRLKHPTVFDWYDALQNGEGFILVNDHDPIPLFYELKAKRGEAFEWLKLESGPEVWKVEISKKGDSCSLPEKPELAAAGSGPRVFVLDVTALDPKLKHPTIFKHFDALPLGGAFQLLNDHDPKPLYYQLIAERGLHFSWQYIQKGPLWWQVEIRKNERGVTVGELAASDMRKAEVFRRHGIDFCCGGKKSLRQACEEGELDQASIEAELLDCQKVAPRALSNHFDRWQPDFLADYIYNQHHVYYYDEGPVIADLCEKVAARHGNTFPNLPEIKELYHTLQDELKSHFAKEEKVLFPFIKALVKAKRSSDLTELQQYPSIEEPVQMMEADHEAAGEILLEIRKAANNFIVPPGACESFTLLYQKLSDLEADLHQHIHLENNILFPKALALGKEVSSHLS